MIIFLASLAMVWLTFAAVALVIRYLPAMHRGQDWYWREEVVDALQVGAIGLAMLVMASELYHWSPEVFWAVALLIACRLAWRATHRRIHRPLAPQWTEDQLP